jgi:predicted AlkP superfamily pyrophosphatase or phosphodiesterase
MPRLRAFAATGRMRRLRPVLPAVTCSVQSSMLTGKLPRDHGIVGNGWYDRELAEIQFWKQSNHLVGAEKVWEAARRRDPSVTCAKLFWWYNMYSSADWSVTPRPIYKADGRKVPDCYSHPASLRDLLQERMDRFPLFQFWGPGASIDSSRWIAEAAKIVEETYLPTLSLIYLPHLDYGLQKLGPDDPAIARELRAIDNVAGDLIDYFRARDVRVLVLAEYGIEPVDGDVALNRVLREQGSLAVREEDGGELLDAGASEAFAVADHQVAHIYVRDRKRVEGFAEMLAEIPGVERVLQGRERKSAGIDHARAGDLVLVAAEGKWFSYGYWLDEHRAPDFARTVEIHRKPGYDPLELFIDPRIPAPKLRIAAKLLKKRLGFRALMDVIPLDTSLVRGSHGRRDHAPERRPVAISSHALPRHEDDVLSCTEIRDVILDHLFGD